MDTKNLLLGTVAVLGGLALLASKSEASEDALPETEENNFPSVGFAPSPEVEMFNPAGVVDWIEDTPTVGHFYQVHRGDMMLGHGKRSITWTALYDAAHHIAEESGSSESGAEKYGQAVADNANLRCEYAQLILASTWNDRLYGTWGYGRRDFPGHHGRAIPLSSCHADNLALMTSGADPVRMIEVGTPADKGTGSAVVNGLSRPLLWLPLINLDAILEGDITTRDMVWPGDSRVSGLEPPPHFWRI